MTGQSTPVLVEEQLPARAGGRARELAIAISAANLCYLRIWSELLTYTRADTYLMKAPPPRAAYLAVVVNVLIVAGILYGALQLVRRAAPRRYHFLADTGFLLFLAIPFNALRSVLSEHFDFLKSSLFGVIGKAGVAAVAVCLAAAWITIAIAFHRRAATLAASALFVLFPFCAVTFGQAAWKSWHYDARSFGPNAPAPPLVNARLAPRVLWFICDEWDYRLTFEDRPADLQLPEIDRLRHEGLFATRAFPPGPETPISLPGYFSGRLVQAVRYAGPRELKIRFRGSPGVDDWSKQPSIFSSAHTLGFNTALLAWFHPACRVLHGLTLCEWWEMPLQHNSMGDSFWEMVPDQTRSLFETSLFSVFGQSLTAVQHAKVIQAMVQRSVSVASDRRYGLVVVHLPIPHPPPTYDRRTGHFSLKNRPFAGYFDSLALLDLSIGKVRKAMEAAGMWDNTTVVFTSDHSYRSAGEIDGKWDPRIPFIVKMAGQGQDALYPRAFNTVLLHDLVLDILRGKVSTASGAVQWLNQNRLRTPIEEPAIPEG